MAVTDERTLRDRLNEGLRARGLQLCANLTCNNIVNPLDMVFGTLCQGCRRGSCAACIGKDAEIARLRLALETAQAATRRALEGCST